MSVQDHSKSVRTRKKESLIGSV